MTIQVDQTASIVSSVGTSVTCAFSSLPNPNALLVVCGWREGASSGFSFSDAQGNTYVQAASSIADNVSLVVQSLTYFVNNKLSLPGSAPFNVTFSSTVSTFLAVTARTYTSTVQGTFLPDGTQENSNQNSNATSISVTSGTPSFANSLFVSAMTTGSAGASEGVSVTGLNAVHVANDGSAGQVGGMADLIATDQVAKTANWSWSAGDSVAVSTSIVPFYIVPSNTRTTFVISQAVPRSAYR
jgi:hypothetical protein